MNSPADGDAVTAVVPASSERSEALPTLRTKPRRQFPFLSRHPWVHAHALAESDATASESFTPGQAIRLTDHDGNFLATGLVNPASRLRVRLLAFEADETLDDAWLFGKIDAAMARRRLTGAAPPDGGERLVFSESDGISGLIVDRYADCLSVQFTAAALLPRGPALIEQLLAGCAAQGTPCGRVVVRMDASTAKQEGVDPTQLAALEAWQRGIQSTDELVWYRHNELTLAVDLRLGQKTGGYLDQQTNHAAAAKYMAGRRVLDVCTYTGGFALSAAAAGATEVIGVDSSQRSLELAGLNAQRNSLSQVKFELADCFSDLKDRAQRGDRFDAVILDPPRFAGSRHQIDTAMRAYLRLNGSAVELLPPGGILVTCSCSGRVSRADFLNMLVDVGRRSRRDLTILETRGPAPDHPFAAACPESDYLKCLIVQVN